VQGVAMTRQPAARRRQTDARWLIDAGLLLIAVSNYWMSRMNLDISPDQVICLGPAWSFFDSYPRVRYRLAKCG